MPSRLLVAALVVVCAAPVWAGRRAQTFLCRQSCGVAIQACVDGGGRPRRCKRQIIRRCRREGITVCVPPQTYFVTREGVDGPACGTATAPCRTIQFVLDQLIPVGGAGTIKVAAGTFDDLAPCPIGNVPNQTVVCIADRQITLLGGFLPPGWDVAADPGGTIIDAKGAGRGVRVARTGPRQPTASLEMDGFTIQHGTVRGDGSGDVDHGWAFGGGMLVESCGIVLRRTTFDTNQAIGGSTAQSAGGRGVGGGLALIGDTSSPDPAPVVLQDVAFSGNEAHGGTGADAGGYALGGALFAYRIVVQGDGLVLADNVAAAGGSDGSGTSGVDRSDGLGGAVCAQLGSTVDLRHVRATGNRAVGGAAPNGEAGGAFGGAFFAELASLAVSDATIRDNLAQGGDGKNTTGAAAIAQGGGVFATMSSLTLDRTQIVGNEARAGNGAVYGGVPEGGGVAVTVGSQDGSPTPFAITNSVIARNLVSVGAGGFAGGGGGGVFLQAATGTIAYSTLAGNQLSDARLLGSAVGLLVVPGSATQVSLRDDIVANHAMPGGDPRCHSYAAVWVAENAAADLAGVLFADNAHDSNAGQVGGCDVHPGSFTMAGIVNGADAGFVAPNAPDDDYHLVGASPAIDRAMDASVAMDIDGTARPQGRASDLGAYEFVR